MADKNKNQNHDERPDGKRSCRFFSSGKSCPYGASCKFPHDATQKVPTKEKSKDGRTAAKVSRHYQVVAEVSKHLPVYERLIRQHKSDALSPEEMKQFFQTGSILIGSDQNSYTIQSTIVLLAEHDGLNVLKTMIEKYVQQAASLAERATIWGDQVRPFFLMLYNPRVTSSAVLESNLSMILNFIVGAVGQRLDVLYDFICQVLTRDSKGTPSETRCEDVRRVITLFSMILDCSISNMVKPVFKNIAHRLSALLQSYGDHASLSLVQAKRYLSYIDQRLEVGSKIPRVERQAVDQVKTTPFVLKTDFPGHLSSIGHRHTNDHAAISDINILPTNDEILSTRAEYWPTTDMQQSHVNGIQWLLDRSFRLLREDTVGQIRDAIRERLESMATNGYGSGVDMGLSQENQRRIYIYSGARLKYLKFTSRDGLSLAVQFRRPETAPLLEEEQMEWWEESRRLSRSALVCVVNAERQAMFCTVNHLRQPQQKTPGRRSDPDPTVRLDDEWVHISLNMLDSTGDALRWAAAWKRSPGSYSIVEFPGVLLPAFQPTLEALQKMSQKPNLPFSDWLIPQDTKGQQLKMQPPLYSQQPGFRFNLECLTADGDDFWYSPNESPDPDALSRNSKLDPTQALALLNSLRYSVALTEGPPGTGKSFTGGALIRVLLANKGQANTGPIICVTYTNHALDQVLEHLMRDGVENIVRIGSRSNSEKLQSVNLFELSRNVARTKHEVRVLKSAYAAQEGARCGAKLPVSCLGSKHSGTALKKFLEERFPNQHNMLFATMDQDGFTQVTKEPREILRSWCRGGSRSMSNRPLAVLMGEPLDKLCHRERVDVYNHWVSEMEKEHLAQVEEAQTSWTSAKGKINQVHREIDARCLREANVIGVTTSGMARNMDLLGSVNAKVLVCEEAGEVLEANVLTAFLPTIEHTILIGDHLQLRPRISNYDFQASHSRGVQYSFDVSLFERLVKPFQAQNGPIPFTMLQRQRRMHPQISELIRETVYPELTDSGPVREYPEVAGMRRRLFWFHHKNYEAGRNPQDTMETSYSNPFEIGMTLSLVSHLVRQGVYKPGEIAVITPYMAQCRMLKEHLETMFEVVLSDRDQAELEGKEEDAQSDDEPDVNAASASLLQTVRVATIDNFQGEEAKVIIISLVRSNHERKVGFLKTKNRINVLLSRAQHGMYILGDAETAATVPMWDQVIKMLVSKGNFGEALPLRCPRHPDVIINVSNPDHFLQFAPDGGCERRCETRLDCGHACPGMCHSALLHDAVKCLKPCQRPKKGCTHDCPYICSEPCEEKCSTVLRDLELDLPCGHRVDTTACWQAQNPSTIKCTVRVDKTVPSCGHTVNVQCWQDVEQDTWKCKVPCGAPLKCGHNCQKPCHSCSTTRAKLDNKDDHGACQQLCQRPYTTCKHTCLDLCHPHTICQPCHAPCEVQCSHSKCPKLCHEPCPPCSEDSCDSKCPHSACTMPCAVPCDRVPCSKRCEEILPCGHQCPSFCGEICPSSKFCQHCGTDDVRDAVVDMVLLRTYEEISLDETPCMFLSCGHFFTGETLDGQMGMSTYYDLTEDGTPRSIKGPSLPFEAEGMKACPTCRGPLNNILRYSRIVLHSLLDESTKRFITWSMRELSRLGQSLIDELERLQHYTTSLQVMKPSVMHLQGPRPEQMTQIKQSHQTRALKGILALRDRIQTHVVHVAREEQPFQKAADLVAYARRHRTVKGVFSFEISQIQLGGYVKTCSLLLRCDLAILGTLAKAAASRQGPISELLIDFNPYKESADTLEEIATDAKRPFEKTESHIYHGQICAMEGVLPSKGTKSTEQHIKSQEARQSAELQLAKAREEIGSHPSCAKLMSELEAVEAMIRDSSTYASVSLEEKRAVFIALQKEFVSTGHWYTCENGHYFAIGERGQAMETQNCYECGAPVGGTRYGEFGE